MIKSSSQQEIRKEPLTNCKKSFLIIVFSKEMRTNAISAANMSQKPIFSMPNIPKINNIPDIPIQVIGNTSSNFFSKKETPNTLPDASNIKTVELNIGVPPKQKQCGYRSKPHKKRKLR